MKQIILSLIAFIGASLNACMAKDIETSETRNLSGYTSIHIDGVATVRFTQSDTYSCRIEGKAKEVARLTTTVENGILTIEQRIDHKREQNIQGATLYLSPLPLRPRAGRSEIGRRRRIRMRRTAESRRHPFQNRRSKQTENQRPALRQR